MNIFDTIKDYLYIDSVKPLNFPDGFLTEVNVLDLSRKKTTQSIGFSRCKSEQTKAIP